MFTDYDHAWNVRLSEIAVRSSTYCLRAKSYTKFGNMYVVCTSSFRDVYWLGKFLEARRHDVALLVHAEESLRPGVHMFTGTCDVPAMYGQRAHKTLTPCVF